MDYTTIMGIAVFGGFLSLLIVVFLQHRQTSHLVAALTEAVTAFSGTTQALDLLEPLATKVVPVSLVDTLDKGAELAKAVTNDDIDRLIEAVQDLLMKVTDGLPNDAPPTTYRWQPAAANTNRTFAGSAPTSATEPPAGEPAG